MALVLKTSDAERHRGFESLSLRHFVPIPCHMEKYPSGRRGSPAKGVVRVNRSESSNLSFSARIPQTLMYQGLAGFLFCRDPEGKFVYLCLYFSIYYTIYNILTALMG